MIELEANVGPKVIVSTLQGVGNFEDNEESENKQNATRCNMKHLEGIARK